VLDAGTKLGPYEILSPLGVGGMGEVYRAKDSKLDREVAIKVLPEIFSRDPERVARFQREAKVLASLNHPNIAAIYGFEESDDLRFLVMELVEGDTLSQKLKNNPLPVEEALQAGKQISQALDAAHENGVIHRDLKPANIKITPDGKIKVLDFGLAKALSTEDRTQTEIANSPTITANFTRPGVVMGTAAYMSPEQARGKPIDKRTDIWAFGCVLFESLSGCAVFQGETSTDILGAIIHKDPAWELLPPDTPPIVRLLLRRCLAKDRDKRLRDIGDARVEIEDAINDPMSSSLSLAGAAWSAASVGRKRQSGFSMVAGIVLGAIITGVTFYGLRPADPEPPLRKFEISVPKLDIADPMLSPDGCKIAYSSEGKLWVRDLSELQSYEVPDSKEINCIFWSPDSEYIGFTSGNRMWKVPAIGGRKTAIASLNDSFSPAGGAGWDENGKIIYTTGNSGLMSVSAFGGDPVEVLKTDPQKEDDFHDASVLPGGHGVIFIVHPLSGTIDTIAVWDGQQSKYVLKVSGERLNNPVYSPTGHILFHRSTTTPGIWAFTFSLDKLEATGEPFLVVPDGSNPHVSADGTLMYVQGSGGAALEMIWVNRKGEVEGVVGQPQTGLLYPSISPDGDRISVSSNENENRDIWIHDVQRSTKTRFTFTTENDLFSQWTPDGQHIIYMTVEDNKGKSYIKITDGTGEAIYLNDGAVMDVSNDGKYMVFVKRNVQDKRDIGYKKLEDDSEAVIFLATEADETNPKISPDGKYIIYQSDENGTESIYLKKFPGGEGQWQVSIHGGRRPIWSHKGDEIFYNIDGKMMAVSIQTEPAVVLGTPQEIFNLNTLGISFFRGYDIAPDDQRFVMIRMEGSNLESRGITIVENWFAEFKDRNKK